MPMPARDSSATPVAARSASEQDTDSAAGSASRTTVPTARSRTPAASGRRSASISRTCSCPLPTDALSCAGVPSAMTRPRSMTAIPSASWSASSRYWVQSRIVVPPATRARQISHTWPRDRGSRPVVGSSRNISRGVTTMLAAMSSRRRIPPEKCLTSRPEASLIPNASSSSSARAFAPARESPSSRPSRIRFSRPVSSSSTDASWPVRLTWARTASPSVRMSWPSTRAVPASGGIRVASMRIVVVLPAPLGPSTP